MAVNAFVYYPLAECQKQAKYDTEYEAPNYQEPETSDAESETGLELLVSSEGSSSSGTQSKKPQSDYQRRNGFSRDQG